MTFEEESPEGGVDELAGKIVLDQIVVLFGETIGYEALESVGGVSQGHSNAKSGKYPVESSEVISFINDRLVENFLPDASPGDDKSREEESDNKSSICGVPVIDNLREGWFVDNNGVRSLVGT